MEYENLKSNLLENIKKIETLINQGAADSLAKKYILDEANSYGCEVLGITDSLYIKKGDDPKAILHINIDARGEYKSINLTENDDLELSSGRNFYLVNALLVISSLLKYSANDFDILITQNNIQKDNRTYSGLSNILRTSNIINLNLRQSNCIADEFSALILSNIKVPLERFDPDYSYESYKISLSNLIGGRAGEDIDKVRLNAIKTLTSFIRKVKSKVDLDITGFEAGDRYDSIPSFGDIYFTVKSEFENALYDIFELYKNELLEKNLKHEPDMDISLLKMSNEEVHPMNELSYNHLASFIELLPIGAFSVDNENDQLISSINLAISRSFADSIRFIVVYRSLSEEMMNQMLEKTNIAMKISTSELVNSFSIPRWKNKDNYLTEIFESSFFDLTGEHLPVIKTQYSLDSSIIFNNLDVKMISLGVEYKQGDDGRYYTKLADIYKTANLVESALSRL